MIELEDHEAEQAIKLLGIMCQLAVEPWYKAQARALHDELNRRLVRSLESDSVTVKLEVRRQHVEEDHVQSRAAKPQGK